LRHFAAANGDRGRGWTRTERAREPGRDHAPAHSGPGAVVAASDDAQLVTGGYVVIPLEWDSFEALE